MPPGKKNKRDECGLSNHEKSTPQKANVVDNDEDAANFFDASDNIKETNPLEIKMLLVDVQATIFSILHEQEVFKTELADLKASLDSNKKELKELKD